MIVERQTCSCHAPYLSLMLLHQNVGQGRDNGQYSCFTQLILDVSWGQAWYCEVVGWLVSEQFFWRTAPRILMKRTQHWIWLVWLADIACNERRESKTKWSFFKFQKGFWLYSRFFKFWRWARCLQRYSSQLQLRSGLEMLPVRPSVRPSVDKKSGEPRQGFFRFFAWMFLTINARNVHGVFSRKNLENRAKDFLAFLHKCSLLLD